MTTFLSSKCVLTRKPHRCYGCGKVFPVGTALLKETYASDGVHTVYTCQDCHHWIQENTKDWSVADFETLLPGEIGTWEDGVWCVQRQWV